MSLNDDIRTERLLAWYDKNGRTLPWRSDPTPYHVWLSEIMLQQTRVEAVKEYYRRFTEALPDIAALAAAPEEQYMKLWEGLGYYSRVRNLHKAAVQVMEDYGGRMPDRKAELLKLAGIGDYTSSAVASIAFHEKTPAIDGNLLRVFARMTKEEEQIKSGNAKKKAEQWFLEFMPESRPGDFNQAVMDLGATVCLPNGTPECGMCPWQELCRAHRDGTELRYPVIPPKKERKKENRTVLILIDGDGRIALRKRPETGLLAGLWEYPSVEGTLTPKEAADAAIGMVMSSASLPVREDLKSHPTDPADGTVCKEQRRPERTGEAEKGSGTSTAEVMDLRELPRAKHIFSHIEWHMTGYAVQIRDAEKDPLSLPFLWVSPQEIQETYTVPTALVKYSEWIRGQYLSSKES